MLGFKEFSEGRMKDIDIDRIENNKKLFKWNYKLTNLSTNAKGINFTKYNGSVNAKDEIAAKKSAIGQYAMAYHKKMKSKGHKSPINVVRRELYDSKYIKVILTPVKYS